MRKGVKFKRTKHRENYFRSWALSIQPKIPEISIRNQMELTISIRSDRNIRDHLCRWSTFTGQLIFFWSDQNVLFHLTKLLSSITLFCILLTRITKPNARWLGPGLSNRSILFRFRNFKPKLDVLNKAFLDSSCVLVIMKFFGVTFLQKRRNCSKTERFDLLKTCNLKEERKDGKKKEREDLYQGITSNTNAGFN